MSKPPVATNKKMKLINYNKGVFFIKEPRNQDKIFQIYSDESGVPSERYQSIACLSGQSRYLYDLKEKISNILNQNKISEMKFKDINNFGPKFRIAKEFFFESINYSANKYIRIDILTYDTQDSRHSVRNIDKMKNFQIMYYKLLRHISEIQNQIDWEFYPDEHSKVDWQEIIAYLNNTNKIKPYFLSLFEENNIKINFSSVKQQKSEHEPLIQLADLYAGISRFSREKGKEFLRWREKNSSCAQDLPLNLKENVTENSKTDLCRFELLDEILNEYKNYKWHISINEKKYLNTFNPKSPINFWNYTPQYTKDKAPIKRQTP